MRPTRVYVDTSVFGGVNDEEFAGPSRRFFEQVNNGHFILLISQLVLDELQPAPPAVKQVFETISKEYIERIEMNQETANLADAYLAAGVLSQASRTDAMHVAMATVTRTSLVLSWNFKHIVNFKRIQQFNSVNLANGYGLIDIRSPLEVVYENED